MPTYSHSRLSAFEDCPRRYHYQYIAKLPVEEEGIDGKRGEGVGCIHAQKRGAWSI